MKIEKINGLDSRIYELIGPYAMNSKFIKENGNPITTSKMHEWYIGFDKDNRIACFCSVKKSDQTKNMQIGNLFILKGARQAFNALVKQIIKDVATDKNIGLRAYANNETMKWYAELGFNMNTEGVNWHQMKYEKDIQQK